jgi:hypothetical protein
MGGIFPLLILNARPAAGKSEIIAYLHGLDEDVRRKRFHIGSVAEIDDFPMLWTWFEEDAILQDMGFPRLHSNKQGYFTATYLWHVLIRRICLEYDKLRRDRTDLPEHTTVILEFSRGKEHGGYREAYGHLSGPVVESASILYVDVSYEESARKNRRRFNPDKPDSILEHGLPEEKMETLYRDTDWHELVEDSPEFLSVRGRRVPYIEFDNADDVTTAGGPKLGTRLETALSVLWENHLRRG